MELTVDRDHLGTPESEWYRSGRLHALPPLDVGRPRRVVVVAPHPDDEVLGAGGLLQRLTGSAAPVEVLAVTDGERSHPAGRAHRTVDLARVRQTETLQALRRLCYPAPTVTRLGLPDGQVAGHEERLVDALSSRAHRDDLWVVPWRSDGHPDHDACGRAASYAAEAHGVRSFSYLVWAWHWADPHGEDLPWARCRRLELDQKAVDRKRWAIQAFRTQIRPLGDHPADQAVLPPAVLARFHRRMEVFVDGTST